MAWWRHPYPPSIRGAGWMVSLRTMGRHRNGPCANSRITVSRWRLSSPQRPHHRSIIVRLDVLAASTDHDRVQAIHGRAPSQRARVYGRAFRRYRSSRFSGSVATLYLDHMSGAGAIISLGTRAVLHSRADGWRRRSEGVLE